MFATKTPVVGAVRLRVDELVEPINGGQQGGLCLDGVLVRDLRGEARGHELLVELARALHGLGKRQPSIGAAVVMPGVLRNERLGLRLLRIGTGWLPGIGTGAFCWVPTAAPACWPGGGGVCPSTTEQVASDVVSRSGFMERVQYIGREMNGG